MEDIHANVFETVGVMGLDADSDPCTPAGSCCLISTNSTSVACCSPTGTLSIVGVMNNECYGRKITVGVTLNSVCGGKNVVVGAELIQGDTTFCLKTKVCSVAATCCNGTITDTFCFVVPNSVCASPTVFTANLYANYIC